MSTKVLTNQYVTQTLEKEKIKIKNIATLFPVLFVVVLTRII